MQFTIFIKLKKLLLTRSFFKTHFTLLTYFELTGCGVLKLFKHSDKVYLA